MVPDQVSEKKEMFGYIEDFNQNFRELDIAVILNLDCNFVLDKRGEPLMPCHPARARKLLAKGRAGFTICFHLIGNYAQLSRGRFSIRPRNNPQYYTGSYPFIQIGDLPKEGGYVNEHKQTLNEKGLKVSKEFEKDTIAIAIVGATIGNTGPLPPLEEQKEIVRQVEKLFTLADKLEIHYQNAKARIDKLPQSILAKAFRGELMSQDPNDEPAEKLLERINEEELNGLNRIVTMYLDYAEMQAQNRKIMTMTDWIQKLDAFLQFNEKDILKNAGHVSAQIANTFAENEFEKYRVIQDRIFESDFDREIKRLEGKK